MSAQKFSHWLLTAPPWSRTSYYVGELAKECDAAKEGAEILKLRALVCDAGREVRTVSARRLRPRQQCPRLRLPRPEAPDPSANARRPLTRHTRAEKGLKNVAYYETTTATYATANTERTDTSARSRQGAGERSFESRGGASRCPRQSEQRSALPRRCVSGVDVGRMVKFTKDGKFVTTDDNAEISEEMDFIALADQTLVGWIKFNGQGEAPTREMGLLYDGYEMPPRDSLGDIDKSRWEIGLNGQPQDPWQHHVYLVLQSVGTSELFTYVTSSITGRRAIGNLLRHYDRMVKTHPHMYPIVRLKVGGFQHRDERVGWVPTPVIAVIGRKPRDDAAAPNAPAPARSDFNDDIPY
jgi:hypothetical protein